MEYQDDGHQRAAATRANLQSDPIRDSQTQKMRSRFCSLGRLADTWKTARCWRSARFSAARAARVKERAEPEDANAYRAHGYASVRIMPEFSQPDSLNRPKRATPSDAMRTEFSVGILVSRHAGAENVRSTVRGKARLKPGPGGYMASRAASHGAAHRICRARSDGHAGQSRGYAVGG